MLFDRFCRRSAPHRLRGLVPASLRAVGVTLLMLPFAGQALPSANAAGGAEPRAALARPAAVPQPLRDARPLGRLPQASVVKIGISLPWRNAGQLETLIQRLSDRNDSLYKKYLTHQQFLARYAPTQADYDAVKAWAAANGLSVSGTTASRKMLYVSGRRDAVEAAFHVQLNRFQLATGRVVFANDTTPSAPKSIASHISGVIGLTDYPQTRPQYIRKDSAGLRPMVVATPVGSGPGGGLTPADIRSIYNVTPLSSAGLDGTGQTVALYEQNGYDPKDIAQYATSYGLPAPNLQNVLLGGFTGVPDDPATQPEVTLDIELVMALAPKAKILVYEFDSSTDLVTTIVTVLTQIADDNLAQVVSISYGGAEADANFGGELTPESEVFQEMAAQGQSVFAAAGDTGAYNLVESDATNPGTYLLDVLNPASQPFVTAVGGTTLTKAPLVNGISTYGTETTWGDTTDTRQSPQGAGGGGGESTFWSKPSYQIGVGSSATMRDVPDVSLNADPNTGYSVFLASQGTLVGGGVTGFANFGGTSASSPLWTAFAALVNQQRGIFGLTPVGFMNPDIYTIAEGADYGADFHDIADGSTNLFYAAAKGYDDATGWGTFVANNLLPEFAPTTFGSGAVDVTVVDSNGNPVPGATVTVTTSQIQNFQTQVTADKNGAATFALPLGVHNFNNSGQDGTLSYIVSASATGLAGQSVANVVPPATIQLKVQAPDHTYPGGPIQMISSPYDYSTVGDFATLFGLTPPLGISGSTAQLYAFAPALAAYVNYPTAPADTLRRGQGYWALLPANSYVHRIGVPPTSQTFRINLLPGWNMIGDPFLQNVSVSNIQVDTVTPGSPVGIGAATTVQLPFYSYNGTSYQNVSTGASLQPYQGYWVHATAPAVLVIPVP